MSAVNIGVFYETFFHFLQTVVLSYPQLPNDMTKKKYHDMFMNLPLFIPNGTFSKIVETYLTEYPISPYLDTREDIQLWLLHFYNKMNEKIEIPSIDFASFYQSYYTKFDENAKDNVNNNLYYRQMTKYGICLFGAIFAFYLFLKN